MSVSFLADGLLLTTEYAPPSLWRILVKIRLSFLSRVVTFAMLAGTISWGSLLHAQQTSPDAQQPPPQTQPSPDTQTPSSQMPSAQSPNQSGQGTPSQSQPGQTGSQPSPDAQAQSSDPTGVQTFSGTVMKQGNKFVLQDASGTTYDIDHQDEVSKFEGKRVRVHGTLDASGKMIHLQ
jgi:cytoskeletal protein RodZ